MYVSSLTPPERWPLVIVRASGVLPWANFLKPQR
jgi:hypothetical protein